MRSKRAMLSVVFLLTAVAAASAEVALDDVVQAGRFVLYRDHADAHKYYYVPDAPRLATKRDGTPEFSFIKYTKTDGATKGGIIHFLVMWGMTEGELSSAESALRLKDPEAKIAGPVPFKEGIFKVVSATAGEGGIFSRRIVGEGKAPIMPGQKAAVSIALSEEGASLLWESFKNPTSDISVLFDLKFAGVTPAFQAKLKVNWDKVYTQHDIKLHAEGTIKVVKVQADVRAILEELRQQGAIQLEVVGENQDMQKMLDVVYGHLLALMCDKVPLGPGEAASPPAKKSPVPALISDWPDVAPAWSMDVLAEVVRAADERLRGGPFFDQEQARPQSSTELPPSLGCDDASKRRFEQLFGQGVTLHIDGKYSEAAEKFKESYAACPVPLSLFQAAICYDVLQIFPAAADYYRKFLAGTEGNDFYDGLRPGVRARLRKLDEASTWLDAAIGYDANGQYEAAAMAYKRYFEETHSLRSLMTAGSLFRGEGQRTGESGFYEKALECFDEFLRVAGDAERKLGIVTEQEIRTIESYREDIRQRLAGGRAGEARAAGQQQAPVSTEEARRQRRQEAQQAAQQAQAGQAQAGGAAQQTTSTGTQAGGTKPPGTTTEGGTKPPGGQAQAGTTAGGQSQQGLSTGQAAKPPDTGGGTKPPAGQTPPAKPGTKPGTKPGQTPEIKPIVSVQIGYSFKRVKMSGNYEVDMRKRLREDRDIVMSGNIGGIFQRYGEDKRFFSVVSLDDPTFQERSIEVILDGQDASDFTNFINSVSVLFRKQRFSGVPMTGEVKFVDQQFAQSGNRQSFKYGRLNEASTEWLDYEYKPKWSFYGGVEWEGEWTKTSDSVLTLTPPVRRRTLEISVDEDNILKNNIKALAIQIKHTIYGKDILKEVVINYDKGDPLQANYTYMHEDGNLGYGYKIVWLLLDGREVHTDWMSKESPFIYAVYAKK